MAKAPVKVVLVEPVQVGEETYSEFDLREPRARDLMDFEISSDMGGKANKMRLGMFLDVAKNTCSCPGKVIDLLSIKDAIKVMEVIGDFLGDGPETGEDTSPE